jgi:hypothetical protein
MNVVTDRTRDGKGKSRWNEDNVLSSTTKYLRRIRLSIWNPWYSGFAMAFVTGWVTIYFMDGAPAWNDFYFEGGIFIVRYLNRNRRFTILSFMWREK